MSKHSSFPRIDLFGVVISIAIVAFFVGFSFLAMAPPNGQEQPQQQTRIYTYIINGTGRTVEFDNSTLGPANCITGQGLLRGEIWGGNVGNVIVGELKCRNISLGMVNPQDPGGNNKGVQEVTPATIPGAKACVADPTNVGNSKWQVICKFPS